MSLKAFQPSGVLVKRICRTPTCLHQRKRFPSSCPARAYRTVSASRTIQYPTKVVYNILSDFPSYSAFVPCCRSSEVISSCEAGTFGISSPKEVKLTIGLSGSLSKDLRFCIYLQPETVVQAIICTTSTSVQTDKSQRLDCRLQGSQHPTGKENLFVHLSARWNLRTFPYKLPPSIATEPHNTHKNHDETSPVPSQEATQMSFTIEYQFANPVYSALSAAVASKVAEKMVGAFEDRVNAMGGRRLGVKDEAAFIRKS